VKRRLCVYDTLRIVFLHFDLGRNNNSSNNSNDLKVFRGVRMSYYFILFRMGGNASWMEQTALALFGMRNVYCTLCGAIECMKT